MFIVRLLWIVILAFGSMTVNGQTIRSGSDTSHVHKDKLPKFVSFSSNSFLLTDSATKVLDQFARVITNPENVDINDVYVLLSIRSCESENRKDIFIGVKRAVTIIDYFEKQYGLRRNLFYIIDNHSEEIVGREKNKIKCNKKVGISLIIGLI